MSARAFIRRFLLSMVLVVGIVLSPLRAVAATIPTFIADDAGVLPTTTMVLQGQDAVRPEAEPFSVNDYDGARLAYIGASSPYGTGEATAYGSPLNPYPAGIGGVLAYDRALNLTERREPSEGVIYCAAAATTAAEAAEAGGIRITQKGLDIVTEHLAQFGEHAPNQAMLDRLGSAVGSRVTGADANFYLHEISESTMMGRGMSYDAAHAAALEKYGVSPFSLYHPEVIQQFPAEFNNAWRAFWGL
jgi:hypothetical protein